MPLIVRPCRLDECAQVLDLWRQAEAIPRPTDTLPDVERMVREHPATLLVGLAAMAIFNLFIDGFYQRHFWILLACAFGLPIFRAVRRAVPAARAAS